MPDLTDCESFSGAESEKLVLPTRQRNALRVLLNKPCFSPQDIAVLDVRVVERAPGIGRKSIELINAWLASHGYNLSGTLRTSSSSRQLQKQRKLQQAIDLLRGHGYDVHHP